MQEIQQIQKKYHLSLELYNSYTLRTGVIFSSTDNGTMQLVIRLLGYGEPYPLSYGSVVTLNITNPNGKKISSTANIVNYEQGEILYDVKSSDIAVVGEMTASIEVTRGDKKLTWQEFSFQVRGSHSSDTDYVEEEPEKEKAFWAWLPKLSDSGELSWELSSINSPPSPMNIMGQPGKDGVIGKDGADGAEGKSNYALWLEAGNEGTLEDYINNIQITIEGEKVLNRSVVGVAGTMERRAIPMNTTATVKFIPTEGQIETIDANGAWICPKDGVWKFSVWFGQIPTAANFIQSYIRKNDILAGYSYGENNATPTINCTIKCLKGDFVAISYYISTAQAQTSNPSSFSIMLDTSINLNTWDLYEQWKTQDSERENISFDIWQMQNIQDSMYHVWLDNGHNGTKNTFLNWFRDGFYSVDDALSISDVERIKAKLAWGENGANAKVGVEYWTGDYHNNTTQKVYGKKAPFGAYPNNSTKLVQHNIQNIDKIIGYQCFPYDTGDALRQTVGMFTSNNSTSAGTHVMIAITKSDIKAFTAANYASYALDYATIIYTCTDR